MKWFSQIIAFIFLFVLYSQNGNAQCGSVININGCGSTYEQTFTSNGTGNWDESMCGFSTPGSEQVYSFIAPTTGTYNIEVTSASGYVDFGWLEGICAETGWTCIDDITSTGTYGSMSWTSGTTYYILLDDENTTSGTHTFYVSSAISAPTINSAINVTCNSFDARWGSVSGATNYYLDVSTAWDFSSFVSGYNNLDVGNVLTYSVTGLNGSTTYYYRVRAYNGCGTSSSSSYQSVNTSAGLSAPSINSATSITCNSFNANWATVSGATKYYLDVSTDWSFGSFVTGYNNLDVGLGLTYSVNTNLNPGTTYYYRVRAYNVCGMSSNSSYSSPTTSSVTTPTANAASGITCNSFNANWTSYTGATTYYLDVSTAWDFSSFVTGYENLNVGLVITYPVNTNLNSSTTYYYRIRAVSLCGTSPSSAYRSLSTSSGLSAPSINSATSITCNSFSANWATVSGATKYYLDVSTDWLFGSFVTGYNNLDVGLVLTYSVNTNLNPGTTYYYRVRAYNDCGTSSNSSYSSPTTSSVTTPTANAASDITCNSFNSNWTAYAGATTYYLDVSTAWDFSSFVTGYENLNVGLVTTYPVNTNLNSSTTYYYRVRAVSLCGTSPSSAYRSLSTSSGLSAPSTNAATNITCTSFSANWSTVTGATKYYLDVSTDWSFGSFVTGYNNLDVGLVLTYNVTGLDTETTYYYRVRAYNVCGSSSSSFYTSLSTGSAPDAPVAEEATSLCGSDFMANWQSVWDATGYYLDVSISSDFSSFVTGYDNLDVGNLTSYNVTGLSLSTTYYYRVRAYDACASGNSNIITVNTGTGSVPVNDLCVDYITLTVGSFCSFTGYTNACGTLSSSGGTTSLCDANMGADVWFQAVVPASGNLNVMTLEGGMIDATIAAYTGIDCNNLTEYTCNDDYSSVIHIGYMPELRIRDEALAGETLWIRVWAANNGATGTFSICAYEPDPPAPCDGNDIPADRCSDAVPICESNSYCGNTSDYYSRDFPGNMCEGCSLFDGSIENNSWIVFQANAVSASLHVEVTNCSEGIQMGIYKAQNCNNFELVSDIDYTSVYGGQFDFILSNEVDLVPGDTYYLMIDGYAGAVCDYTITPLEGINAIDAGPDVCNTGDVQLGVTGGGVGATYLWSPSTGLDDPNIQNPVANPSSTTTYTVTVSNSGGSNPLCPDGSYSDDVIIYDEITTTFAAVGPYCSGAAIGALSTTSTNGITGTWSPAINNTATTTYTFTPTVGQCGTTITLTITITPSITPTFAAVGPYCSGAAIGAFPVT
jgi:hypothetical protein